MAQVFATKDQPINILNNGIGNASYDDAWIVLNGYDDNSIIFGENNEYFIERISESCDITNAINGKAEKDKAAAVATVRLPIYLDTSEDQQVFTSVGEAIAFLLL